MSDGYADRKRFRRFRFRFRFREKQFRRFRFPVPVRFLGHPSNKLKLPFGGDLALQGHCLKNCLAREESQSSKDGPGSDCPLPNSAELWDSAGGFCGTFCLVEALLKNPHTEPPKVLRNFGSQAQLFRPCNFSHQPILGVMCDEN